MPSTARVGLGEPLSHTLLPLIYGLGRRLMLKGGALQAQQQIAGISVNYYHQPAQPMAQGQMPILLIHGIGDSALTWCLLLRELSALGPVYAIDLPGFGLSGFPLGRRYASLSEHVDLVRQFIREVIGQPALLVGNSLGGWIATRIASQSPADTKGIVLLDPGGALLEGRPSWEPFIQMVAVPNLRSVRKIFRQIYGHVPLGLYLGQQSFRNIFLRDPVTQFIANAQETEFLPAEELQQISVPHALIWGQADRFLPSGSFEFFRDHLPQPEMLELPGCGHMPQHERPFRVLRFIRAFIANQLNMESL